MIGRQPALSNCTIMGPVKRIVIVAAKESYRTGDFLAAASLLRIDAVVATDAVPPVAGRAQIQIDLAKPEKAAAVIAALEPRPDAVIAVDDQGVVVAAEAAAALGLKSNAPSAVRATRDKLVMRNLLDTERISQPRYRAAGPGEVVRAAKDLGYPVVVKPRVLSASRGVIRADGPTAAERAEERIRSILSSAGRNPQSRLLVEEYVPGDEAAVEGLMVDGSLEVLAVIDKPDPLTGPYFEETIYTTPPDTQIVSNNR